MGQKEIRDDSGGRVEIPKGFGRSRKKQNGRRTR